MSFPDPFGPWRRFLALPNDSRAKTLTMAFLVSAFCALAVSSAAVLLGPRLDANRAAEREARLQAMIGALPGLAEVLAESGADRMETLIVDLHSGGIAEGIDPESFDPQAVARDPALNTALAPEADIAGIGSRPDLVRLHVARQGRQVALVILPIYGAGYQSTIRGYLALSGDLNTVAGFTVTEQSETPGLGARIAEPAWQALWPGTLISDDTGALRIAVARGPSGSEYEIDGITGATRTGAGVTNMMRFWLGPDGFGPVLDALRGGAL